MSASTLNAASGVRSARLRVHPLAVRLWHWINAFAIVIMITSGWRIYDASPVFPGIRFPPQITLGGWLAGALQWHFAAMWLLMINFAVYILYGVMSGHFARKMTPIAPRDVVHDLGAALSFKLAHNDVTTYNAVQKLAYVGVLAAILITILAGLAIWKPVQFQELAWLFGGYDGARVVHFFGMAAIVLFLIIHLALVTLVPSTFLPMITGDAKPAGAAPQHQRSNAR
ncbi:thiosulfate reductase cytochrome b subunit [Roseiarcus fermentans]|uniref:Thiosulfate reductase cytochrome b subunit n=1 Tax=Roseiarcus fermentans TaxID=1473586 RepID=A0A366EI50_9HYPH|nr:thiosulfate reductase cytochrome b subunit [Roseiarcus fermentans]